MIRALSPLTVALLLAGPAAAAETGRYTLQAVEGGFIRLDTGTGAVSHCGLREDQWRCEPVADAEAALQDEINRLAAEKAALEQRLAALGEPQAGRRAAPGLELPNQEEVDRVFTFLEGIMRRFVDFARSLNEDPGRET